MAIDTAPKRKAVAALSLAHYFGPGVTPDATPDQAWRQTVGYGYPGILAGGAAAAEDMPGNPMIASLARMMNR